MDPRGQKISRAIIVVVLSLISLQMAVHVTTNPQGGLVAMVPLLTVVFSLIAAVNPMRGVYTLAGIVIWIDEFKRLAVYFGDISSNTVIQCLAMPFIVIAAINAGHFYKVLSGGARIDKTSIFIYILATMMALAGFITVDGSIATKIQRAANLAGYMTLIPVCRSYMNGFDEWRKFFSFQVICAFPALVWAIYQYYFGFNNIEWTYAESMLSPVHSYQMLSDPTPRTFGLFGSASALGCVAIYCSYAWWHALRHAAKRIFWILAALLLTWVLFVSTQRTSLMYPLIVLISTLCFRYRVTTLGYYSAAILTFILGVIYSDYLLDKGLDKINSTIETEGEWGSEVLRVSTFSDRLFGWQRLKRPDSWSLLGTGKENYSAAALGPRAGSADFNHDMINKILIHYGALGLLVMMVPTVILIRSTHLLILRTPDLEIRKDKAFALALTLPTIYLGIVGGDNLNTNPINLQVWTAFVGVVVTQYALKNTRSIRGIQALESQQQA